MKYYFLIPYFLLVSGCAVMESINSPTTSPNTMNEKLSSLVRANAINPYYEFLYQIREQCDFSNKEPMVSVVKEKLDSDFFDKLVVSNKSDKENFKLLHEALRSSQCKFNKQDFLSIAKKYKCFMASTQRGCLEYKKQKDLLSKDAYGPEDSYVIKQLEKENSICAKNWDSIEQRSDQFCHVVPAEPDSVSIDQ